MTEWIIKKEFNQDIKLNDPVLIGGLPGIGNVGKLAVDYMIDELKPILLYNIHSHLFPNSVFINEKNIIELPQISIYAIKSKGPRDLLLLAGDVQPVDEESSYKFCNKILDLAHEFGCKEVLTLGGIGLPAASKNPRIFGAATDENIIQRYQSMDGQIDFKKNKASTIVGAAGLLLGLSQLRNWSGASMLVETFGHRYHLGLREAKQLLVSIDKLFTLQMDLSSLDKEIKRAEKAAKENPEEGEEGQAFSKSIKRLGGTGKEDTSYIG